MHKIILVSFALVFMSGCETLKRYVDPDELQQVTDAFDELKEAKEAEYQDRLDAAREKFEDKKDEAVIELKDWVSDVKTKLLEQ